MNLTAKPRRGDMGGHANQYFTSSATGWWGMGAGCRGVADTVTELDRKRSQEDPVRAERLHLTLEQ